MTPQGARADLAQQEGNKMNFFDKSKGILCFIRHGQTDWNLEFKMQGREEIPLNRTGITQAHECASGLAEAMRTAGVSWTKIISSPLGRAYETAKIIRDAVGCEYFGIDARITERDFGELSGLVYEEYSKATFHNVPEVKTVETIEALMDRLNEFIADNVGIGERVLIVTHGAVTRIFARNSKKSPQIPEDFEQTIGNCNLVIYTYDGTEVELQAYNLSPWALAELVNKNNK